MIKAVAYQTDEFGTTIRYDDGRVLRSSSRPPMSFDYEVITYTHNTKTRFWDGNIYPLTSEEITEVESYIESVSADEELSEQMARVHQSRKILQSTDWYVVRYMDTGKDIPDNIKKLREKARELANE